MQTNREDCGHRYREIIIPKPKSRVWADRVSEAFRNYFTTIDAAKKAFVAQTTGSKYEYIANVFSAVPPAETVADESDVDDSDE